MGARCRAELIQMVREAGLELIDRGETMIPEGNGLITSAVITIRIPLDKEMVAIPTIEASVEMVCKSSMEKYKA